MKASVLILAKRQDPKAREAMKAISKWLKQKGVKPIEVGAGDGQIPGARLHNVVAGVSFGGDGTFLGLVNRLPKKDQFPLIGVNLGTLGFITNVTLSELKTELSQVLAGTSREEKRGLFELEIRRGPSLVHRGVFLNDAVILRKPESAMLRFEVRVDGVVLTRLRADGLVLSSATGSTAYALSAGGPLVYPTVSVMILVPICPHTTASRPIILPSQAVVEVTLIEVLSESLIIFDGQRKIPVKEGDVLVAHPPKVALRLVGGGIGQWTEALRNKLRYP